MDTEVPVYGTNSSSGAAQHHNIFDMYQSFLGHFWGADRLGGNVQDMMGKLGQVFPGITDKIDQAQNALSDAGNPIGQIFSKVFDKGQS